MDRIICWIANVLHIDSLHCWSVVDEKRGVLHPDTLYQAKRCVVCGKEKVEPINGYFKENE